MSDVLLRQPRFGTARTVRSIRRNKVAVVGFVGIALLMLTAVLAPWLAPYDPHQQELANVLAPPVWAGGEWAHVLGTDSLGRDVLSRLFYGTRSSVFISVSAMLLGAALGVTAGVASGFLGRAVDAVLMRLGDIQLALPFILIAIVILGMMTNRRPLHLVLVLGVPAWIVYARVVRSRVLAERDKDYVRAAKTLGASKWRRMTRYVWPQVRSAVPPIALVDLSNLIIMESTLSFLGFGLTPPAISWGQILAEGRQNMVTSPWLPVLPGLAIMLTVLTVNLAVERPVTGARRRWFGRGGAFGSVVAAKDDDGGTSRNVPVAGSVPDDGVILRVRDLQVEFPGHDKTVQAVRGVSFELGRARILGIVGESGSGKSVTAFAIMRLLTEPGRITGGQVLFEGKDLVQAPESVMRTLRGSQMGMIFQNPTGSLNPVLTVGQQMNEVVRLHRKLDRAAARRAAVEALRTVGFGDPEHILRQYPFRLSGGQNQRVMIALTMVTRPKLLLADEPTTALDVTTQAQVLGQLEHLRDEQGTSIVIISHDMGLIGEIADDTVVMYAGKVCEQGPTERILRAPQHPYTKALLASIPEPGVPELRAIPGDLPDPSAQIIGCPFADRCPSVMNVCREVDPVLVATEPDHSTACHLYSETKVGTPA